jgi:hypothetical protein
MFPLSGRWRMVAAIGHGVLFSLALTGAVRIGGWLLGTPLPENVAGSLFLTSSILAGALAAFLCAKTMPATAAKPSS